MWLYVVYLNFILANLRRIMKLTKKKAPTTKRQRRRAMESMEWNSVIWFLWLFFLLKWEGKTNWTNSECYCDLCTAQQQLTRANTRNAPYRQLYRFCDGIYCIHWGRTCQWHWPYEILNLVRFSMCALRMAHSALFPGVIDIFIHRRCARILMYCGTSLIVASFIYYAYNSY